MKSKHFLGIRIKFLFIFFISLAAGLFFAFFINGISRDKKTEYSKEISVFNNRYFSLFEEMKKNTNSTVALQNIINENTVHVDIVDIFVVNKEGIVLLKPKNNFEKQLDIDGLLNREIQTNFHEKQIKYYTVKALDEDRYVVISTYLVMGDEGKYFLLGILLFIFLFLLLTYGRVKYIDTLSQGLMEISKGVLDHVVAIKGKDELSVLGENINYMAQALKKMKEREKQAEQNRDMLIVNVSHDLRTPLTSIIGYVKLIKEKYIEKDEISKYIDILDYKSQNLEERINDLFEYTKLTSCDIELEKMEISLNEFMRQIVEGIMPVCSQNNLNILLEQPEEELYVNIDPVKMVRVFENIVINAVRYSNKPSDITIKVSKQQPGAIVSIKNEGKPIKKEDYSKIFDRSYRTDGARNSQTGGSGLGLSIAKSIVELHKGNIWVESEENKVILYVLLPE